MTDAELIARHDGRVPRYTSYPTAPHFRPEVGAGCYADWLAALPAEAALSLYLHVPFCDRLCLYCGCNTAVVRQEAPRRAYAALLERELRMVAACLGRRAAVAQVHWGGGTPTALPADCLTGIMELIRSVFDVRAEAEIAIELDPVNLPADRMAALRGMGVTRASLGVQDFDPQVQQAIGRQQSYEQTQACVRALRAMGVGSLNLDLIYGLPRQTVPGVAATARRALGLGADRVAVFGYAHVPWMKRHQSLIPPETLPGPLARFEQCRAIDQVLTEEGGYGAVGLDHYARPGDGLARAASAGRLHRNFQGYTADEAPVLLGLGASAIGTLPQGYVQNAPSVPAYAAAVGAGRFATARGAALTAEDRLRRAVIERIMCDLEADLDGIAAAHGMDPAPLHRATEGLERFEQDGLARYDRGRLRVTPAGRPFVRSVAALFDAYLPDSLATPRHAQAV